MFRAVSAADALLSAADTALYCLTFCDYSESGRRRAFRRSEQLHIFYFVQEGASQNAMMNLLEEAIIYATVLHQGVRRKNSDIPYILHPLEVAQILSTMTDDQEIIAAGVLHDVVEDTDGTLSEVKARFGDRVARLVASETENKYPEEDEGSTWKKRKEESLLVLKNSSDAGVKMLWLADKLSNLRSISRDYSERGEDLWSSFHQSDPDMHRWYYRTVAEYIEYALNKTGAYKEFIQHINFVWPETFDTAKTRFRKYREVSVDGCRQIGYGAKGTVYQYDDETIIKVYNENNTYTDVEREIELSRKAFIIGLPMAISFGIVSVGNRYGAMFELLDSMTISQLIARDASRVPYYAEIMANLAHQIHDTEMDMEKDDFPNAVNWFMERTEAGLRLEDSSLADRVQELLRALPPTRHLTHGDYHTGNVFIHNGEPLLVDMDRLAYGHPIIDLAGMYLFYVAFGETNPRIVEDFMGFPYKTALRFYQRFMAKYLNTSDKNRIREVTDKAALLAYVRQIGRIRLKGETSPEKSAEKSALVEKIRDLIGRVDSLMI